MSYLLIILRCPPVLRIRCVDSPIRINVEDCDFLEIRPDNDDGLFLGFYDWLRASDGEIVGLRITFHDEREQAIQGLSRSRFGEWEAPEIFRLMFRNDAQVDEVMSIDQEFSLSRIYRSPKNGYALLLDAQGVEDELSRLVI